MRTLTAIDDREIKELLARDEFFWLDLTAPGEEDMRSLGELLHLHPVAVEAASTFPERPRLEDFARGVIDLGHVIFFLSVSAWLLVLTFVALEMRRWR